MANATITVNPGYIIDNTQKMMQIKGQLTVGPAANTYVTGGVPGLDAAILALVQTNSGIRRVIMTSTTGTGYAYQRNAATGTLKIMQGGSAVSSPAAEVPNTTTMAVISTDPIDFVAEVLRNA